MSEEKREAVKTDAADRELKPVESAAKATDPANPKKNVKPAVAEFTERKVKKAAD